MPAPPLVPRALRPGCLLAALALVSACIAPKTERSRLRGDLVRMEREIQMVEEVADHSRARLIDRLEKTESEIARLDQRLEALTGEEGELVQLQLDNEALRAELLDTQQRLARVRRTVHDILLGHLRIPGVAEEEIDQVAGQRIPTDPTAHLKLGKRFMEEGNFDAAQQTLTLFLHRYKEHPDAWKALFTVGQAHYARARREDPGDARDEAYRQAIVAFQRLMVAFPRTPRADEALYTIGKSFEALGHASDAQLFYQELLTAFPQSPLVEKVRKRM